jgi:hypothetical protein
VAGDLDAISVLAAEHGLGGCLVVGETGGDDLVIETGGGARLEVEVAAAHEAFERGVADHFS